MQAMFADGQVAVTASGEGPPLVLLHSLLADATSFDRVAPRPRPRFPDPDPGPARVRRLRAGAGRPRGRGRPGGAGGARGDRGRAVAGLGNGYGGFVLLLCALRHPGLFDRLVFADCGACFSEPGREAFRTMARVAGETGLRRSPTRRCGACSRPPSRPRIRT